MITKPIRFVFALLVALSVVPASRVHAAQRMNIMIITIDDMSCDSVGVYGCKLKDTTPNMDRLAGQSMRFNHAFVQVGNCMPSRNVMFSGRYPHNNRVEGFYQIKNPGYPVMADLMKGAGYFTGIRGKVPHSTPYSPYPAWDIVLDRMADDSPAETKNVMSYYDSAKQGIAAAKKAGKPFCLNINISDPHKPFFNENGNDKNLPSRIFTAAEVPVPGFLMDDPGVREELALYYSSVRRGDDCLGNVLKALKESGEDENTVIFFLSDHGMPLPFAKTQLYFHSTRTPWMIRWPGVTKPGSVDDRHMVSAVDLLPTLLEVMSVAAPKGMDGRSFAPVLKGGTQEGRDYIVSEYNENSGGFRHPMRSIVTKDFAYLFNPWSNGKRVMATATKGTITYRRMVALAKTDQEVAQRLDLFEHRVPEEMFNYATDPDALTNLIDKPEYRADRERLVKLLDDWMVRTGDGMLDVFRKRNDLSVREAYMKQMEQESAGRKESGEKPARGKKKGIAKAVAAIAEPTKVALQPGSKLIELQLPASVSKGGDIVAKVVHTFPADAGEQALTVTLKGADGARIERKVVKAKGSGTAAVTFSVPPTAGESVTVAAFVGEDYQSTPQHLNSKPVPVR